MTKIEYSELLERSPYSLDKEEKQKLMTQRLMELTRYHYENCTEYRRMLNAVGFSFSAVNSYYDIPFLPVRLFKELQLKSIRDEDVFKVLTSSGTTGQLVSKIYLDKDGASYQQKTLAKIFTSFTGMGRMPMLIIDSPSVIKNRLMFSARGAGILGFSVFGSDRTYALDEEMNLNVQIVAEFLEKHKGKRVFLFGFTFIIWQHFYRELLRKKKLGMEFDFSNAILIHGGGWKKLASEAISQEVFKECLKKVCGLESVHDYYGMVEQTGTVYMQCECGHLHASLFSDVIIRKPFDFSITEVGETGIIQVVSMLPESYPGHSLLTEDEGILLGEDDCPCQRKGKYFKILGRISNAEIRGCSDTYAASIS